MNTAKTVLLSVLSAAAVALAANRFFPNGAPVAQPDDAAALRADIAGLQQELEALRAAARAAEAASAASPAAAGSMRTEQPDVTEGQVAAAVEAYLKERGASTLAQAAAGGDEPAPRPFDLERDLATLLGTNYWEAQDAWRRAFDAGQMDAVIASMQELADANRNDPQAQMDVANACLAYMQMDNTKWQMSMRADQQFDRVLALDDHHWEARFSKAVSYTFYPDFLGKKGEAIQHFETLVQQQESLPVQDEHAQTYVYLGNMLAERDPARARQIWQRGAARHPQSQELQKKLGGN